MAVESLARPPGLDSYTAFLRDEAYRTVAVRTVTIAGVVTGLCVLIGYPVAYGITSTSGVPRGLLLAGVTAPYISSALVRTFAWQVLLSRVGPVTQLLAMLDVQRAELLFTPWAVIIGLVQIELPLMILPLVSVMGRIDRMALQGAQSLGAGPARTFARIFMPQTVTGVEAGCILVFVGAVGAFITPAILGGQSGIMLGAILHLAITRFVDFGLAAAGAVLITLGLLMLLLIYTRWMGGRVEWLAAREGAPALPVAGRQMTRGCWQYLTRIGRRLVDSAAAMLDRTGLSRSRGPLMLWTFAVVAFLALPSLIAVPISLSPTRTLVFPPGGVSLIWYREFLTEEWLAPARTSLVVAATTAVGATVLGGCAAVSVVRGLSGRLAAVVRMLLVAPIVVPHVVVAVALYFAFAPLGLTNSVGGLILAHTVLVLPFAFVVLSAVVRALDPTYERAAASLGARRGTVLRRIVLPLTTPGVCAALFLSFISSFDESVVSIFLSGLDVKTLPRRMFEALTTESDPRVAVVATVSLLAATAVLVGTAMPRRSGPNV
jgi:putative spermidine/putrescine transport system permease protein